MSHAVVKTAKLNHISNVLVTSEAEFKFNAKHFTQPEAM